MFEKRKRPIYMHRAHILLWGMILFSLINMAGMAEPAQCKD